MLLLWTRAAPYWPVGLGYGLIGIGVGLAGTPASRSLTGSVPVPLMRRDGVGHRGPAARPRRRHHAVDLRSAASTAGYAAAAAAATPRRRPRERRGQPRASRTSSRCPTRCRRPSRRATRRTPTRHRPDARTSFLDGARPGRTPQASSPCSSARRWSSSSSHVRTRSIACWRSIRTQDSRGRAAGARRADAGHRRAGRHEAGTVSRAMDLTPASTSASATSRSST